jgi:hypothetical protein
LLRRNVGGLTDACAVVVCPRVGLSNLDASWRFQRFHARSRRFDSELLS